jgi:hypothetical protein
MRIRRRSRYKVEGPAGDGSNQETRNKANMGQHGPADKSVEYSLADSRLKGYTFGP